MKTDLSFRHRFVPGAAPDRPPLLLLHGTGGDENDLIPLGRAVAPGAALLSPRGNVTENGMPRFFRRFAEGVFDEDDVRRRAHELADFMAEARALYGIARPIALGYSNGANIAAAVLLLRPDALAGAVLLRPMMPLWSAPPPDVTGTPVLLLAGASDPAKAVEALRSALTAGGAEVEHRTIPAGHGLTAGDVDLVQRWLARHAATA